MIYLICNFIEIELLILICEESSGTEHVFSVQKESIIWISMKIFIARVIWNVDKVMQMT